MRNYQATPDFYNDYISHHGRLGQKWGERHGPPYPLDRETVSEAYGGKKGSMGRGDIKKKKRIAYTIAGLEKGLKNGKIDPKDLSRDEWNRLSQFQMNSMDRKNPGFKEWYENEDPDYSNYDVKNPEKHINEYLERNNPSNSITEDDKSKTTFEESKERLDKADLFTEHNYTKASSEKDLQRGREAADLGLEALNKIGRSGYEPENGITESDREWFIWEDQTIGLATIADLVNQGKSKEEIMDLIRDAQDVWDNEDYKSVKPGTFQLAESHNTNKFIDACIEIRDSKTKEGSKGKPKIDSDKVYVKRPDNLSEVNLSKKNSDKNTAETLKSIDKTKVVMDGHGDILGLDFKDKGSNTNVSVWGFTEDVSDKDIKDAAKKVTANRAQIKKLAEEAIKDEKIYQDWHKDMPWGKDSKLSEKEFLDKLEIQNVYVTPGGNIEISVYEKGGQGEDYSLLGGHSIDMEFNLNNLKKPKYVSMNG